MSIRKHTLYNLMGSLLPLGLSLVTIPTYIHLIGESRYGVLAIAWLLLGYFGLFDLGLGRATAQRIAALVDSSAFERTQTFWTALAINGILGVAGGLIIWPVAEYFFNHFFSVETALRSELDAAIPWMVLAVPLTTISGVVSGALQGRSQFLELNFISMGSALLTQLLPLAVAYLCGPNLAWLLPAAIFAQLATITTLFYRCRKHVFLGQPLSVSRAKATGLLQFGGWVTVTSLVGPMMVILDRFAIGALLGAKAVTYYTVPFQLSQRTTILSGALSSAMFPRLAAASGAEARKLTSVGIHILAIVMTPLVIFGVFLMQPFLNSWLGADFASAAALPGQILLLGFWVNAFAAIPYAQLQAGNKPHIVAKCHLIELLPYLLALYVGLHFYGIVGAAVVFGLRTAVDCVLLMYFARVLGQSVRFLIVPVMLLLITIGSVMVWSIESMWWWMASTFLLSISIAWSWHSAQDDLLKFARQMISRRASHDT